MTASAVIAHPIEPTNRVARRTQRSSCLISSGGVLRVVTDPQR
jgi:hypothetical protein